MTQWTGCGECDCAFPCHNGESRCIRLTPKQEQEPIGWLDGDETLAEFMHRDLKAAHDRCGSATPREFTIPVYLAPPAAQPENGDIRALKYRIHELEGEVLGYKRMLEEAALKKLADLGQQIEQEPIGWLDGADMMAEFLHRDMKAAHDRCGSATPREFTIPVYLAPPAAQRKKEHITNGDPCWCNPEIDYVDPETGVAVIVHKEPQ